MSFKISYSDEYFKHKDNLNIKINQSKRCNNNWSSTQKIFKIETSKK